MEDALAKLKDLFTSPRFVSFYWATAAMVAAGLFDLILQNIGVLDLPEWAVVALGLAFAQITKALKNRSEMKPMGFVTKK